MQPQARWPGGLIRTALQLLCSWGLAAPALAQQRVDVPSFDRPAGQAVQLPGHWFASAQPGRRPAVLLLHGCGGAVDAQGRLFERWAGQASLLNAEAWHVLVLDSFSPRGARQICTQKLGTRAITQLQRRRDVLGALQWLAQQPAVDPQRLAMIGWSNGGSSVLSAINRRHPEVIAAPVHARAAVALYPGCETERQRGFVPASALMLQLGGDDDWTPAQPCQALAAEAITGAAGNAAVSAPLITVHPGAHHGFDTDRPVRLRSDVPNGVRPGEGVHVGAQPEARERSRQEVLHFLRSRLNGAVQGNAEQVPADAACLDSGCAARRKPQP